MEDKSTTFQGLQLRTYENELNSVDKKVQDRKSAWDEGYSRTIFIWSAKMVVSNKLFVAFAIVYLVDISVVDGYVINREIDNNNDTDGIGRCER